MQQFYEEKIVNELRSAEEVKLEAAFLGKSKESLDRIDLSLMLDSAIQLFGSFLHYHTRSTEQVLPPARDTFAVLMASQRQLLMPGLPPCVIACSKKDKLYNDFIGLLKEENASFSASEVNSSGRLHKNSSRLLVGRRRAHDTLQKQSCTLSQLFQCFVAIYITPELLKHRKR